MTAEDKVLEKLLKLKNSKIQNISVAVQIGLMKLDIKTLQKIHKITSGEADAILDILNNIKEKI